MAMTFSQYTLLGEVGETADAIIHRGLPTSGGAPVWIKTPNSEGVSPRDIARVKLEYAITRDLDVPGVVKAIGLCRSGDGLALVLEDFGGRPLRHLLRERRIDLPAALWIAASIAETLSSIHRRGVVHRRVTPESILVDLGARRVGLSDFSAATRLSREKAPRAARLDALPATLPYLSPEQTGRVDRAIDRRADLYSLGVVLFEMLTGSLPFPTRDPVEIVHSTIARIPPSPREIARELPEVVSGIAMKLLAKSAEDRYQLAEGLSADLTACLSALSVSAEIPPFPLDRRSQGELRIPDKLYGREAEISALRRAWARVRGGARELVRIEGSAGTGKSALAREIGDAVAKERGYFVKGRFEKASGGAPYAAIARAFQGLLEQILTESEASFAAYRRDLSTALGQSGQVLVDILPALSPILGLLPGVPSLPPPSLPHPALANPSDAQNRLKLVFQGFVRVFTTSAHPLVLFLDDLQWADPASLKLLELLMMDPESAHLLVICAHRAEEVEKGLLLERSITSIQDAGVAVSTLSLGPLSRADVGRLLADALSCDEERARPVAEILFASTRGVPLALHQHLETLREAAWISFDPRSNSFTWDLAHLEALIGEGDIASRTDAKIQRLAPATRRVLSLAASIGRRFDLGTLSSLHERSPGATAADLWDALSEGLVLPLHADYRLLHVSEGPFEADPRSSLRGPLALADQTFDVAYEFLHERVQQAAYALLDDPERRSIHHRIGRLLRAGAPRGGEDEALFEIVRHEILGAPWITLRRERAEVAGLTLLAGRRAKQRAAYQAAAGYFQAGSALLDEASWEEDRDLAFALLMEQAECEHIDGGFDRAEALFEAAVAHARSALEQAKIAGVRVVLYTTQGRVADAVRVGQAALALLGIELPAAEERQRAMDAELAEARASLAGRSVSSLLDAPELLDPVHKAALDLLQALQVAAHLTSPALRSVVILKHVNISLKHGHSAVSAYGYMAYAALLGRTLQRYQEAHAFGRLALDLNERFGNADVTCKLHHFFASFLHFLRPVDEALSHYERAIRAGLASGDFQYLSFAACNAVAARIGRGDELRGCLEQVERFAGLLEQTGDATGKVFLQVGRQVVKNLLGWTRHRLTLSDDTFDERELAAVLERPGFSIAATFYHVMKLELLFLHGDHEGALAAALLAQRTGAGSEGMYFATDLSFYACLTLTALHAVHVIHPWEPSKAMLAEHRGRLEAWAASCPENFEHKRLLVAAEIARVSGDELSAMALYDEAIEAARRSEFARDEALASELSAMFHLERGRQIIARAYMTHAYFDHLRWGATAKAEDLATAHPYLVPRPSPRPDASAGADRADLLDVATILRAAQAIVQELVLEEVLSRSMWLVLENAGAQRGVLLLARDGQLTVEAAIRTDPDAVEVAPMGLAEDREDLALSIVQYVARTKTPVVLGDATREGRFAADPHIVATRPKSLLCLPLVSQGGVAGVLYLENNVARGAFSKDRTELLRVLSSLSAIAVKNALLYARIQAMTAELQRTNESLSIAVQRRTEELSEVNAQLSAELALRAQNEQKRAALQEEIIAAQRERLVELSAPLMPLTDRIMVMPLLGRVDIERAEQVLEAGLRGAHRNRTRFMILDITGVKDVDASAASVLLRTAAALALIGTRVVLTGVRPDVARAFIELGIDLGALVTRSTLASGIAYALEQRGGGPPFAGRGRHRT